MRKHFCKVPFGQMEVSPSGECRVCCKMRSDVVVRDDAGNPYRVQETSLSTIWNSNWMNDLRQRFLNDEKLEECKICWDDEDAGLDSYRTKGHIYLNVDIENPELKELVLKLSNKCNSACRICNSYLSSLWQSEDEKYGIFRPRIPENKINENNYEDWKNVLDNLESLYLFGGEPLINTEVLQILEYLKNKDLSPNIKLTLSTNATVTSDKVFSLLNTFKLLIVSFSVDDIDERYNYERWPANFDSIYRDLIKLHDNDKYNKQIVRLYVTVSIFNILHLGQILEKFERFSKWNIAMDNLLNFPSYLCLYNLPEKVKLFVKEYLESVDWDKPKWVENTHKNIKNNLIGFMYLYESPYSCEEYIKLLDNNLGPIDSRRSQNWRETFPELYKLLIEG